MSFTVTAGRGRRNHVQLSRAVRFRQAANVTQAFGHDTAGGGRNINGNHDARIFKGLLNFLGGNNARIELNNLFPLNRAIRQTEIIEKFFCQSVRNFGEFNFKFFFAFFGAAAERFDDVGIKRFASGDEFPKTLTTRLQIAIAGKRSSIAAAIAPCQSM